MKKKAQLLITILLFATTAALGQNILTQGAIKGYKIKMNIGEQGGATYKWTVEPSGGTSTDLTVVMADTATIIWDGLAGVYTLSVQVTDGNGCLSEPVSQSIEIQDPGELVFAENFSGTVVCSDLSGGAEGSSPEHSLSSFLITYTGTANLLSANVTIKDPDGNFIDLNGVVLSNQGMPEVTILNTELDKEIAFNVTDSWENNSASNVMFEIVIVSGKTVDNTEITANPLSDVMRNVTVLPKPVIAFE